MSNNVHGNLHVANDVLSDIAGNAALECYGVVDMATPNPVNGLISILPNQRLRRGIVLKNSDEGLKVELYVVIEYGVNINSVSQNLIDSVSFALKNYACVDLASVEVHVQDVKVR